MVRMSSLITKKRRGRPRSTRQKKGKAAILTLGEVMRQDNLPMEEAAVECRRICGKVHEDENTHCFRYLNGHQYVLVVKNIQGSKGGQLRKNGEDLIKKK